MNTPNDCGDDTISRLLGDEETALLIERGLLAAPPSEPGAKEHPTASWLYRKFRPGNAILSKPDAYKIANELDRLLAENKRLTDRNDRLCSELTSLAGQAFELEAKTDELHRKLSVESFKDQQTEEQIDDAPDRGEYR